MNLSEMFQANAPRAEMQAINRAPAGQWNPQMGLTPEIKAFLDAQAAQGKVGQGNIIPINGKWSAIAVPPSPGGWVSEVDQSTGETKNVYKEPFAGAYTVIENGTDKNAWHPGIKAYEFNATTGGLNRDFTWKNPDRYTPGEMLAIGVVGAMTGGAALAAMGAGAGAAGAAGAGGAGGGAAAAGGAGAAEAASAAAAAEAAAGGAGAAGAGTAGASLTGGMSSIVPAGMGFNVPMTTGLAEFGGLGAGAGYGAGFGGLEAGMGALGGAGMAGTSLVGGIDGTIPAGMGYNSPMTTGLADYGGFGAGAGYGTQAMGLEAGLANLGAASIPGLTLPDMPPTPPSMPNSSGDPAPMDLPGHELTHATDALDWTKLLGPAATAAGGLLGAQGVQNDATQSRQLPDYLKAPVGDLVNKTSGLLNTQLPIAQQAGAQLLSQGQGLLAAPIAGNGVGKVNLAQGPAAPTYTGAGNGVGQIRLAQGPAMPNTPVAANGFGAVKMDAPQTSSNPYLKGMADDMQRRTQEMLAGNNNQIAGNYVGYGGLGGSRQGVAQGVAAGKAADYLGGQLAGLYGNAYESDSNRALSKYNTDVGFYGQQRGMDLTQRGQDIGMYEGQKNRDLQQYGLDQGFFGQQRGQDLNKYQLDLGNYNQGQDRNLQQYGLDQNFYANQRGQDLTQATVGSGLVNQGINTPFAPLQSTSNIFAPFTGFGSTTTSQQQGGGLQGALGGALGTAQFGKAMGWW